MSLHGGSVDPFAALESADRAIFDVLQREETRLRRTLEMIASENIASPAVLASMATALSNKYAEGYPGKRYYGGCEHVDEAETLAIDRVLELYGADHANVQPHSGAQANMAAYFAVADPGATLMGMKLSDGGHLTHGHRVSFSGRFFKVVQYGVRKEDSLIDYDVLDALVDEHRPQILVAGHSAYPRILDFERFRRAADRVGARLVVDMAHIAGLVATGLHPSPLPHADIVTSTTHKTLRGPRGGLLLCRSELAADVDRTVFPGMQGGPMMHVIAAKAVCFAEALQPSFTAYQEQVLRNALALAKGLIDRGFDLVSGGTETHLVLVDLRSRGITGRVAEAALERARIIVNKNAIPFDPEKPFVTSGIRLGTPAVTTRGMKEAEMEEIADWILQVLDKPQDPTVATIVGAEVERRTSEFPLHASPETFVSGSASG